MAIKAKGTPLEFSWSAERGLTLLVLNLHPERTGILQEGLQAAGFERVIFVSSFSRLQHSIALEQPHVIVVDLGRSDPVAVAHLCRMAREVHCPVVVFMDHAERQMMAQTIEAGVASLVVDGLQKERLGSIVATAILRFQAMEQLRRQRDEAVAALEERKVIERAKGWLMKNRGLSEEEAYHSMRKAAMHDNCRLVEIARLWSRTMT
ncbi:MAG: ANTAR domain-containing protein [Magnetococcales bacterium]|nr:ANTAR domain-containing protein [Magnetococcales bacterium]NGZ27680.1 ANTAR domain-containing protein [Magnetococcales bacterium]